MMGNFNWKGFKMSLTVIGMMMILMLTLGLNLSFGIFLVDFKKYFQTGSAVVGAVTSLSISILCLSAPITSIIGQRLGCRLAVCIGCFLTSFGFFLSSLVQRPWQLLFSHSMLTGLGCSLCFVNIIPLLGIFSERLLAVINGIVYSGNSVGVILFPILCKQIGYYYGFRGAIMIVSALSLNALVLALLMKFADEQLKKKNVKQKSLQEDDIERTKDTDFDTDVKSIRTKVSFINSLKGQVSLCYKFPRFAGLMLANLLLSVGYVGFLIHMVANATYQGMSDSQAALVASVYGVGNVIGRLTHGIPVRYNWISTYHLFWISCLVNSITIICYPYCSSSVLLFILTVIISYNVGIHIPLLPLVMRLFVGDEHFHQAFGILQIPGGVGCLLGGFIAGWIFDLTNSYLHAFVFMGSTYLMVPFIFMAVEVLLKRRKPRTTYTDVQLS